ncbi:hypothetical protein [Burkholderia stagnalis]|uniref:hypothetical protein n=1 Tax=Burkholderia stagnalis TaxID=1503054 RepID=UPI000F583FCD|nr:hypothetical protein [Burkholderia stagnalis]
MLAVDTQLVRLTEMGERATEIADALVLACERQRDRLAGTDYSTAHEAWDVLELPARLSLAAVRFDPRALNAQQIRDDAASIVSTLQRAIERAREAYA